MAEGKINLCLIMLIMFPFVQHNKNVFGVI